MRTRTGQELGWCPLLGPSDGLFQTSRRREQPKVVIEGAAMVFKGLSVRVAGHIVTVEIDEDLGRGRMVLNRPKDGRTPTIIEVEALLGSIATLWIRATRVHPDKRIDKLTREDLVDRAVMAED